MRNTTRLSLGILLLGTILTVAFLPLQGLATPPKRGGGKPPKGESPPADPAIVYAAVKADRVDLMVMNADGSNPVLLLSETGVANREPAWSPDGSKIVFYSDVDPAKPGIYMINRDGTGHCKIADTESSWLLSPAWSPAMLGDDYKIAYSDLLDGVLHIFLVNAACPGGTPIDLTDSSGFSGGFFPTWSPNALQLAAQVEDGTGGSDIVVYDLVVSGTDVTITNETNLTDDGPLSTSPVSRPEWARSGYQIAVDAGPLTHDIWLIDFTDLDSIQYTNITDTPQVHEVMPAWSPDDSQLVFRRDDQNRGKGKLGIYRINADGTGLTPLAGTSKGVTDLYDPDWRRCCEDCAVNCAP